LLYGFGFSEYKRNQIQPLRNKIPFKNIEYKL